MKPITAPPTASMRELVEDGNPGLAAPQSDADQDDGEEDRERIVGRGFDLEGRPDPGPQPQPARMNEQEHRRRIGRGDHRADQERFHPVEAEQHMRRRRGQRGGEQDADVASTRDGAMTLRKVASRVRRPPSNRISASATEPTR